MIETTTLYENWSWWCDAIAKKEHIVFGILTLLFSCLWLAKNSKKTTPSLPPGPYGLPFVGYLPFLGTKLHNQFTDLAKIYGPVYKLWLGNKLNVVISSASPAKEVLRDQDLIFCNRDPSIAVLIATYDANDIAAASYSPDWKKIRKVFVREMLSKSSIEAGYDLRRKEVRRRIKELYTKINTPVDVGEVGVSILINVMMNMLWGAALEGEKGTEFGGQFKNVLAELMHLFSAPDVSEFFPTLAKFDLQGIKKRTIKIHAWFDKVFESAIEKCRGSSEIKEVEKQEKSFLRLLLELEENGDDATSVTITQIKALLMDVIVAGTDTTTTTLEWTMAELMHHPEIMTKVHQELDRVVGQNNSLEEYHLPNLHYLDCVVKETFRLHPPLPLLIPRRPSETVIVGGYTIPKDARIFVNVGAIQRDPEHWDKPLEFVPERFLDDTELFDFYGKNYQYLPFGSGRRICPGIPLGEKMMMFVLGSLLHSYKWRLPDGEMVDFEDTFGLAVKKLKPLIIIPETRLRKDLYM